MLRQARLIATLRQEDNVGAWRVGNGFPFVQELGAQVRAQDAARVLHAARDGFEDVAGGREAGLDAEVVGMNRTFDHAADAGDEAGLAGDRGAERQEPGP